MLLVAMVNLARGLWALIGCNLINALVVHNLQIHFRRSCSADSGGVSVAVKICLHVVC